MKVIVKVTNEVQLRFNNSSLLHRKCSNGAKKSCAKVEIWHVIEGKETTLIFTVNLRRTDKEVNLIHF